MRIYLKNFYIGLQETLQYRMRVFINIGVGFIPVFIQIFLWLAIYNSVGFKEIDNFSFKDMVGYLVLALIINNYLNSGSADRMVGQDIKEGTLSKFLLKPINNFGYYLSSTMSQSIFYLVCLFMPVLIGMFCVFYKDRSPIVILLSLITLFLAYLLNFMFNYIVGLLTFWMTNVSSIFYMKDMIIGFISGKILPLSLFPAGFLAVSKYLPFEYMVYFPINAFLNGDLISISKGLAMQCGWLVILGLIAFILWKLGIKKYSSVGN